MFTHLAVATEKNSTHNIENLLQVDLQPPLLDMKFYFYLPGIFCCMTNSHAY